ncbi:CDP-alcohol phosphatidyltransferase family protein [Actinomadura barringtoniae]|uniref:CDP-alcohol phosphatidyltransferase family protein n=1 Tax=Actinomadura barringtoniae TaxID=1427535 RepID=UPI0024427BEE|nr:CDP-alcohol phosphatidyltransferase family protein [Actinomadura barringtoniae]
MTVAIIIATGRTEEALDPGPTAGLSYGDDPEAPTLLSRLCDQLATLNVPDHRVVTRPDLAPLLRKDDHDVIETEDAAGDLNEIAWLVRGLREPVVVLHGDLVVSTELLARLILDARGPATGFPGALRVPAARVGALADTAGRLVLELGPDDDVVARLGSDLGTPVADCLDPRLACLRADGGPAAHAARTAVEAVDEDKVRLHNAVKGDDGFFTTFAVSTYSRYIARWAAGRGLTPNMVTSISMGIALVAAVWFAAGTRTGMIIGAVLFYLSFVFDCVDGQLARYTRQFSTLGAWLDAVFDRGKEYVVFAGLAIGSSVAAFDSSVHAGNVWALAVAALALQTVRHMIDFSFGTSRRCRTLARALARDEAEAAGAAEVAEVEPVAAKEPERVAAAHDGLVSEGAVVFAPPARDEAADGVAPAARKAEPEAVSEKKASDRGSLVARLSRSTSQVRALHWAKKIIVLPIGERFALIAITAALFNARVTFAALLLWGWVAAMYTLTGRVMRSIAR